jgi:hypothetical protein
MRVWQSIKRLGRPRVAEDLDRYIAWCVEALDGVGKREFEQARDEFLAHEEFRRGLG